MRWGIFQKPDAVHVMPCDRGGTPLEPHVASPTCECRPDPYQAWDWIKPMWSHHDGQ